MIALVRRGESGGEFSKLDLSPVRFPSDELTIRKLRQMHPGSFDLMSDDETDQPKFFFHPTHHNHVDSTVASMLYLERMLAVNAYAAAAGHEGIETGLSDAEMKEELREFYIRYNLASGHHHAAQLIRDFEQQAADRKSVV